MKALYLGGQPKLTYYLPELSTQFPVQNNTIYRAIIYVSVKIHFPAERDRSKYVDYFWLVRQR